MTSTGSWRRSSGPSGRLLPDREPVHERAPTVQARYSRRPPSMPVPADRPPHPAATLRFPVPGSRFPVPGSRFPSPHSPPSMRFLRPFLATWLTGLLAILPLLLTVGLVAWVVGLLDRFVGPESTLGRSLSVLGMLAGNPALAWLVGTAL